MISVFGLVAIHLFNDKSFCRVASSFLIHLYVELRYKRFNGVEKERMKTKQKNEIILFYDYIFLPKCSICIIILFHLAMVMLTDEILN